MLFVSALVYVSRSRFDRASFAVTGSWSIAACDYSLYCRITSLPLPLPLSLSPSLSLPLPLSLSLTHSPSLSRSLTLSPSSLPLPLPPSPSSLSLPPSPSLSPSLSLPLSLSLLLPLYLSLSHSCSWCSDKLWRPCCHVYVLRSQRSRSRRPEVPLVEEAHHPHATSKQPPAIAT